MPQTVSEYLGHVRECAARAEKMRGPDKDRMLDIAKAWLALADERAKKLQASGSQSPKPDNLAPPSR